MAVTYWEMHGWPRGVWNRGEFDGERRLMCAWADRVALLAELDAALFWPTAFYPEGPAAALIREARIFPFGKGNAVAGSSYASYQWCLIDCKYSTRGPKFNETLGVQIEETLESAFHSFAVDTKNLRWESDDKQVNPGDGPLHHDVLVEYQAAFFNLNAVPTWVLTNPGVINSNNVATAGLGVAFEPNTLKYVGSSVKGVYSLGKLAKYRVIAKFVYKKSEWNKFWRPEKLSSTSSGCGEWEKIVNRDGDEYIQHNPVVMSLL